jgi:DNA modification methylase
MPTVPPSADLVIRPCPIAELVPDPANPRQMPDEQMAALMRSIEQFGFVEPVVVRRADRLVIGGHQRAEAARRLGFTHVPIVEVDLTDEQCRTLNVALNRIHGEWDLPKLAEILQALPEDLARLTGFDEEAMRRVVHEAEAVLRALQAEKDLDAVPAPPDEAITKPGDVWLLGRHRLLCGDAGSEADLDRLLDGGAVHLAHCDPPYNVKVEPRSNNAIAAGLSSFSSYGQHHQGFDLARHPEKAKATHERLRAKDRPLQNDFMSDEEFAVLLRRWFGNMARVLLAGRAFYVWGGFSNLANYPPALRDVGLYFSQSIVWDKQHPVLTRKDFMTAHEQCFYGWKEGAAHVFYGPNNVPDLWPVKKLNHTAMVHLTEKPVELAVRAITYSTVPGENVLDLFGGSGSTLIAAETTNRTAFLMELDPLYADVIVQRFEQVTGTKAERVPAEDAR